MSAVDPKTVPWIVGTTRLQSDGVTYSDVYIEGSEPEDEPLLHTYPLDLCQYLVETHNALLSGELVRQTTAGS